MTIKPPTHTSMVWSRTFEIATEKLSENDLPPLDLTKLASQSAEGNMKDVVESLNALLADEKRNRWRYNWCGKEIVIVERLGDILRGVGKYTSIVGAVAQCDPKVGTFVWAGIQGIMQVRI